MPHQSRCDRLTSSVSFRLSSPSTLAPNHELATYRPINQPDNPRGNPPPQTMSQLPLADVTPLRVTGTLFKDLVFAFQPQDIPNGARTLRTLRVSLIASPAPIYP